MVDATAPAESPHGFMVSAGQKAKPLTIKTAGSSGERSSPISISPHLNSPSPPSSAFVSALQSPYISPRALEPPPPPQESTTTYSGSHSDDIPSTSYTPPSERYDSAAPTEQKPKFSDAAQPRISFSFAVPRTSFGKSSVPQSSNAKLRCCDVYIGFHGQNPSLIRLCKWLKSELEIQGIASFVADRAKYSDTQSHEIADRIICSAAYGVIVVTPSSFLNSLSVEEIRFFAQKKNLIPVLFDTEASEIEGLFDVRFDDKESIEAFEGLTRCNEFKLEANDSNWRACVSKSVGVLKSKLGRKSVAEKEKHGIEELPFPRNRSFVGREKELVEIEALFFGCSDMQEIECPKPVLVNGFSDGFADEETDTIRTNGRYISLEMRKCKEPTLEAWIDPVIELSNKGRSLQKQRSKHKKSRMGTNKGFGNSSVLCVNGISGIGKTELVLEFAYRYSHRYKMVLWVGGEARYFRQNILNLSMNLGLDVSAESEKERGRIRSFDEQEFDVFQRVKRELFRDIPYLLIIDNLETEKEWWEGKDLHDLIPRNTGATHVIVTTKLSKVMSFEPMQLQPLPLVDSLILIKGKKKRDYPAEEIEVLNKFVERLGRLSFGLWVIGSLLSELPISPSALFEAIERIPLNDNLVDPLGSDDNGLSRISSFLTKILVFSFSVLGRAKGRTSLALRMALAGAWLAPAPVSSTLLAVAADRLTTEGTNFLNRKKCLDSALFGCSNCWLTSYSQKNEADSALMLAKLGLARRTTRQPGCIQFHPITQAFAKMRGGPQPAKAAVHAVRKTGSSASPDSDHHWASAFLVFGFKSEPPLVQLKTVDMVLFIKKTALPLAVRSFANFSRCSSSLELLKVCTNVLEEVEKSFVSQIQDWHIGSSCWMSKKKKKNLKSSKRVDEYVWQDVTLLKATLLETRAKLLLRGGHFDSGEELCRTCISIRTVMLGHNHAQTLAAQETLAKLVRLRSKI